MNIQLTGIIRKINPSEIKGTFEKRTLHLAEEKDSYPSVWCLEAHQAFCNVLDNYKAGDKVECTVDVTGREWNDMVFNTLKVWKINNVGQSEQPFQQPISSRSHITDIEPLDDLPF